MFKESCTVFVRGKYFKKFANSNFINLTITDVKFLQTVKEKDIHRLTISFDRNTLDETAAGDLITLIEENEGKTELYFQIVDHEHSSNIELRSDKSVNVNLKLIEFIESVEGMDYHIN